MLWLLTRRVSALGSAASLAGQIHVLSEAAVADPGFVQRQAGLMNKGFSSII